MKRARDYGARHDLERILSKAGVCSRTQAQSWIRAGRVRVNGALILDPCAWFDPERDEIAIDGRPLRAGAKLYYVLHKPRGYLTTRTDPRGRPTIYDLLQGLDAWVIAVGRLDLDTSGLLLLTNDTQFAEAVTNPDSHVPKTYRVEVRPRLTAAAFEALRRGVELHDGATRPTQVKVLGERGPCSLFELTLTEGKNRQVRRMVRAVGSKVEKLARVAIGELALGELATGAHRALRPEEVRALLRPARSGEG